MINKIVEIKLPIIVNIEHIKHNFMFILFCLLSKINPKPEEIRIIKQLLPTAISSLTIKNIVINGTDITPPPIPDKTAIVPIRIPIKKSKRIVYQ